MDFGEGFLANVYRDRIAQAEMQRSVLDGSDGKANEAALRLELTCILWVDRTRERRVYS
jgi:hypothetical protein